MQTFMRMISKKRKENENRSIMRRVVQSCGFQLRLPEHSKSTPNISLLYRKDVIKMCLDKITKLNHTLKKERVVFKVVRKGSYLNHDFTGVYSRYGVHFGLNTDTSVGKIYIPPNPHQRCNLRNCIMYKKGFHFFLTKKDALHYLKFGCYRTATARIVRCILPVQDEVTFGIEHIQGKDLKVVVARQFILLGTTHQ